MDKAVHKEGCGGGFSARRALDGRPQFVCSKCGATWTSGWDGEPYLTQARNSGTDNGLMPKTE
jgi:hypothetical protein